METTDGSPLDWRSLVSYVAIALVSAVVREVQIQYKKRRGTLPPADDDTPTKGTTG